MADETVRDPENQDSAPSGPGAGGEALVRKLAGLARLELAPEEVARTAPDLARILAAFQALERAELPAPPAPVGDSRDGLRPDEPHSSPGPDPLLANAPERIENFYGVPKTIGGSP